MPWAPSTHLQAFQHTYNIIVVILHQRTQRIWIDCLIIAAHCHILSAGFISSITIRDRRLKCSMANWKNCRPSFDLLRKVIQGRPSLRWLLAPRKGRPKREIGARVLGTWRNRHPGSVPIPAEFLRFHSSSSALPTRLFRTKSDWLKFSLVVRWNWKGNFGEVV